MPPPAARLSWIFSWCSPLKGLFGKVLRQFLQLRFVAGRTRAIRDDQSHCGVTVIGGKADDIHDAFLTVFPNRLGVSRIGYFPVAVNFGQEIVKDRLVLLHL